MLTSKTLSQAFITRASVHVMCVSCLFRPALISTNTVCASHITSFVTHYPCMSTHMHVYVCVCVSALGCWPGRLLYYFWEGCPFPLEGLIEECLLSPSPPLSGSGSQAKPGSAGLLAAAAAQNRRTRGLYTAQHPQHYTTHRWLDCLLALAVTGVQQVDQGDPTPSVKTDTRRQGGRAAFMCVQ